MSAATYDQQARGSAAAYASYFAGMDRSMQQKVALTTAHFPTAGRVADMGSGSGRGTYDLACLHPELELVGVDINPAAVASAAAAYQRANLRYAQGDIADAVFPPGSLDGILDSSVLHHVTSFTGYSTARLETCLDHQVAALRPGGVLIIRDFVVPDGPEEVDLDLPDGDGAEDGAPTALSTWALWRRYAASVAHSRYRAGDLPWRDLGQPAAGWRRARVRLRDAQEFLLRKDYRADWEVELQEEYTYWTQAAFIAALERRGLRVTVAAPIRNPWIVANRYRGKARLATTAGEALPFPPTNLVIVGQRVAAGQGTSLRPLSTVPAAPPAFLRLHAWRGDDGSLYDLAERPGRTIDLLPWFARDGQVLVLAKQGFPRPIALADAARPNLTGAHWSGWLSEPLAAIVAPDEALPAVVARILRERAGLVPAQVRAIGDAVRYATSPGGLDEVVTAVAIEIDPVTSLQPTTYGGLAEVGVVQALDARACLRAGQVGGLFDARLELGIHRLLRTQGLPRGPWIGAALRLPDHDRPWPRAADALTPPQRVRFVPVAQGAGFLALRRTVFAELDASGRELARIGREWVAPVASSSNTAVLLPLIRCGGTVLAGVEQRWLPAIQAAAGAAGCATVPAWRLPDTVRSLDAAEAWLAGRFAAETGCRCSALIELGGPYLATPGATPELVHAWAAVIDPASGPGALHWLPLADLAAADPLDAHLAIAAQRAAHALT